MSKKKVIILGGGVAGMSAAHELIERDFEVHVFEKKVQLPGGKARSVNVPDPDAGEHYNPLPGEHGFRFFPGFYKHIIDTMKRIPFPGNKDGVADNLVEAPHVMLARSGAEPIVMLDRFPKTFDDFKFLLHSLHQNTGLSEDDEMFFATRVWQLMTSCHARRENDYERLGWWQFTDGAHRGKAYRDLLARGLTRTLVAARAVSASTKTGGDIFLQLVFNMANPNVATDRILNGPTNQQWLHPWLDYLKSKGVNYHFLSEVKKIDCENDIITGVWVEKLKAVPDIFAEGIPEIHDIKKYTADYYICAVPVEVAAPLLLNDILNDPGIIKSNNDKAPTVQQYLSNATVRADFSDPSVSMLDITNVAVRKAAIMKADPTLTGIVELSSDVSWMTGVQFYLEEEVDLNKGHIIFADSPWAVTAISQSQFWKDFPMNKFADGKVKTVLSCDVSDWDTPGILYKKIAKNCTAEEIKEEVWAQMKRALIVNGKCLISDEMIHTWFIDRDIVFDKDSLYKGDYLSRNTEPLLVNKVDTWRLRPESYCAIPNLFFAADYVRTHTDLATMEGANEAARRAVNNIIEAAKVNVPLCEIWDLHEPWPLAYYRYHDYKRYMKGLKWNQEFPWWVKFIQSIITLFRKGAKKLEATKAKPSTA